MPASSVPTIKAPTAIEMTSVADYYDIPQKRTRPNPPPSKPQPKVMTQEPPRATAPPPRAQPTPPHKAGSPPPSAPPRQATPAKAPAPAKSQPTAPPRQQPKPAPSQPAPAQRQLPQPSGSSPAKPAPAPSNNRSLPAPGPGRAQPQPKQGGTPPATLAKQKVQVRALFDFDPENPDELQLKAGDIINVNKKVGEWYEGELRGKVGIFPITYVEETKVKHICFCGQHSQGARPVPTPPGGRGRGK